MMYDTRISKGKKVTSTQAHKHTHNMFMDYVFVLVWLLHTLTFYFTLKTIGCIVLSLDLKLNPYKSSNQLEAYERQIYYNIWRLTRCF